jgi:hypothetical protein
MRLRSILECYKSFLLCISLQFVKREGKPDRRWLDIRWLSFQRDRRSAIACFRQLSKFFLAELPAILGLAARVGQCGRKHSGFLRR